MTEFAYFQTIVQFRVPQNPDGSYGKPQMVKSFTTPYHGTQKKTKNPKKDLEGKSIEEEYI